MQKNEENLRAVMDYVHEHMASELPSEYLSFLTSVVEKWSDKEFICIVGSVATEFAIMRMYHLAKEADADMAVLDEIKLSCEEAEEGYGLLPKNAIPIGMCHGMETILLVVNGAQYGSVMIKTYKTLHDTGVDRAQDDIHFVTSSFGDLLQMLR